MNRVITLLDGNRLLDMSNKIRLSLMILSEKSVTGLTVITRYQNSETVPCVGIISTGPIRQGACGHKKGEATWPRLDSLHADGRT